MTADIDAPQPLSTTGARWVERYLLPLLEHRLEAGQRPLTCLQIEPDDETEAVRLRGAGHDCEMLSLDTIPQTQWYGALGAQGRYDLVFTGYFGRITGNREGRRAMAREIARVTKPRGAFLTTIGNRLCPVDFTKNAATVHSPLSESLVTLTEMERVFEWAGFSAVRPLSLHGHFEMGTASGLLELPAAALKAYWRWGATPARRWLYASPLNPTLMLWIEK